MSLGQSPERLVSAARDLEELHRVQLAFRRAGAPQATFSAVRRKLALPTPGSSTGYWNARNSPDGGTLLRCHVQQVMAIERPPIPGSDGYSPRVPAQHIGERRNLPEPFGPMIACTSPCGTVIDRCPAVFGLPLNGGGKGPANFQPSSVSLHTKHSLSREGRGRVGRGVPPGAPYPTEPLKGLTGQQLSAPSTANSIGSSFSTFLAEPV